MAAKHDPLTALVLETTISAVQELKKLAATDPAKGQKLLRCAWTTHAAEYRRHLDHVKTEEGHPMAIFAEMTALATLVEYFDYHGDWDRMIASLRAKIQSLELGEAS